MYITGDEIVDELRGVGTLDLDLALDGHIPHADMLGQVFVLGEHAAVFGLDVSAGVVLMVVGCVGPAAGRLGEVPPGRLPDAGRDEDAGIAVAALAQVYGQAAALETVDE